MESIYTTSVSDVPKNYNDPTPAYKKHVWIAVAGIVGFFAFYLYLSYWFLSSAYRLLMDASSGGNSSFVSVGIGIGSLFLGIFMVKAFFHVQTKYDVQDRQVKPEDEPVLFDYLHKLADEIGAPRPSKVYLSNRVNASVFYDLSFLNLFFPSKKNLEIGLGLINVLNLGEFKAVLAHEYGHFAQKSMLVGRWVYIANQIATTIITKRDALDSFLRGLSRIDIRIAWIGWILSIIVWSIRSLVELIFRVVVLSQRALSREMEFQADLAAVSVTGSDALIHALHKLQAADAALSDAMSTLEKQLNKGKAIEDLYAVQINALEKTAYILNDEEYGKSPKVPTENPENHRVFSDKIAQPPKMWLTHPPDQEREANAKQRYIAGEIDDRSAWDLFAAPQQLKTEMTKDLIATAKIETELLSTSDALVDHNKQYQKSYFNPKYRGAYLNRFICQEYKRPEEVYLSDMTIDKANEMINRLYPETLVEEIEDYTTLNEEFHQLEAIQDKRLDAGGDGSGIYHRGTPIRRKELPKVITTVKSEVESAKSKVTDHDRMVRTVHLKLAEKVGQGWDVYLQGLLSLVHYSEHNIANIQDAQRSLGHVLQVVMADNQVSSSEMTKLIHECNQVYVAMASVYTQQQHIVYDEQLRKELELEEGQSLFEEFKFPRATQENMNDWLANIESWIGSYVSTLNKLRTESLELLLRSEELVVELDKYQSKSAPPNPPSSINTDYTTLLPGQERELKLKLNLWDKFISADGIVPAIAKFAVAATIVGGTIYYTGFTGVSDLYIYNGLGQAVTVDVGDSEVLVGPHSHNTLALYDPGNVEIMTKTVDGQVIELFKPEIANASAHYVYNVANAGVLGESRIYYGGVPQPYELMHENKRWITTKADYLFEDAPETMSTSSNSTTRDILTGYSEINPIGMLSIITDSDNQLKLIETHATWDPTDAANILQWVGMAAGMDNGKAIIEKRLENYPDEIISLRALMDSGDDALRAEVCKKYTALSEAAPENANAFYIAARCIDDFDQSKSKFFEGINKWPDHSWMNYAASYYFGLDKKWTETYNSYVKAYKNAKSLKPVISLNAARVSNLLKAQSKPIENPVEMDNSYVSYYNSLKFGVVLESGADLDPYDKTQHLIYKGTLPAAVENANTSDGMSPQIIALIGASDGASAEMIDKALALKIDSLDQLTTLAVVALHLRKKKDISGFKTSLDLISEDSKYSISKFIDFIKAGNYNAADDLLTEVDFTTKAQLYSFAYMAYGDKIPNEWRREAKYLLFPSERPYMK